MAEWKNIPDDLDARVRSHATQRGEAVADFVARAVREQMAYEDDAAFAAEIAASIRRGMANVDAGRARPAKEAIRDIASELGIDIKR